MLPDGPGRPAAPGANRYTRGVPQPPSPPVDAAALGARLDALSARVDALTRAAVGGCVQGPARPFGAILEYHHGWRDEHLEPLATPAPAGKKLRAGMVLLACEAVCGATEPAESAAVAVELVHNFSLVHDDIQDRGALRRGRETIWRLWGAEQGINAGDALFALAQVVLLSDASARSAQLAQALNLACLRLVEGQFLDLELQRGTVEATPDLYETMIGRKTGALFDCAMRLGALAGGADERRQAAFGEFGRQLGIAFQEQDDLLGVWGAAAEAGKEASDVASRKKGLPAVMALGAPDAPAWLREAYQPCPEDMPDALAARVVAHFDALGLRQAIANRVEGRYRAALAALASAAPRPAAAGYLAAICDALVGRTF